MSLTNTSPNKNNYRLGGARVYVQRSGTTGYVCLGNIAQADIAPVIQTLDHFTSFSGKRRKDRREITEESYELNIVIDEFNSDNLVLALRADSDSAYTQGALTSHSESIAVVPGRSVRLGKREIVLGTLAITDASDTFAEGTDYEVDYELGIIRWDSSATANAAVSVSYDCEVITGRQFNPGTLDGIQEIDGLVFAFLDNKGGVFEWSAINATLETSGNISLTDTAWSTMPFKISVLATTSSTAPFGTIVQF